MYLKTQGGIYMVDCNEQDLFEDVYLLVNDLWLQVQVKDYFINIEGSCLLAFTESSNYFWLLGDAFLMDYYSIHDNKNHSAARVGFAPSTESTKHDIEVATSVPAKGTSEVLWERTWIFDLYWWLQPDFTAETLVDGYWAWQIVGYIWVSLFGPAKTVSYYLFAGY